MSGQYLRKQYMRQFSGLDRYPIWRARLVVGGYFAQVGVSIVAGHILLQQPGSLLVYLLLAFFMMFLATRFRGLNNIIHECSHATFVVDRLENVRLGSICATILLGSFQSYRDEHLTHHKHLGDYDHDLDLQGIKNLRIHDPLTVGTVTRHIVTPLVGRHLPYYLNLTLTGRDGRVYQAMKYGLIGSVLALLVVQPATAIVMVLVPFLLLYSAMNYWTDCLDHAGLVASEDELDSSRNILAPLPLRILLFPRYDCYHLVHHLFPHVPAKHLGTVHQILEKDVVYRQKPHAVFRAKRADSRGEIIHPAE